MRAELLNAEDHAKLRLAGSSGAVPHFIQIVLSEFRVAAASCPVVLTKDATTGEFYAGAMLGFKPGEALRTTVGERAGFEPLNLIRDGFFVSGERIAIDRDNPRFSETSGDPMFGEDQQPSPQLRRVQRALGELHEGIARTQQFIQALNALKLIEPIDVSLKFDSGEHLSLQGLYTVSMDGLRALPDAEVVKLVRSEYFQLACVMNVSLTQISALAHVRSQRVLENPVSF